MKSKTCEWAIRGGGLTHKVSCVLMALALMLAVGMISGITAQKAFADDTFDVTNYDSATNFTITTDADMTAFASAVNGGTSFSGKTITLAGDVSTSTVIGESDHPFSGNFNGDGHTVTVSITANSGIQALFGVVSGGTNDSIQTIQNLVVSGTVSGKGDYVAGVVAKASGVVTFTCVGNQAAVSNEGGKYTAGILARVADGEYAARFISCYNKGAISSDSQYVAGVIASASYGDNAYIRIRSCYNVGRISTTYGSDGYAPYIGGLAGGDPTSFDCMMMNSVNAGAVTDGATNAEYGNTNIGALGAYEMNGSYAGYYAPDSEEDADYYLAETARQPYGSYNEYSSNGYVKSVANATALAAMWNSLNTTSGTESYAGRWIDGSTINASYSGCPALAWEGTSSSDTVNKTALTSAISSAQSYLGSVTESAETDPANVDYGTLFALAADRNTFSDAITAAQGVADNESATQEQVDTAVATLGEARTMFESAVKTGTKTVYALSFDMTSPSSGAQISKNAGETYECQGENLQYTINGKTPNEVNAGTLTYQIVNRGASSDQDVALSDAIEAEKNSYQNNRFKAPSVTTNVLEAGTYSNVCVKAVWTIGETVVATAYGTTWTITVAAAQPEEEGDYKLTIDDAIENGTLTASISHSGTTQTTKFSAGDTITVTVTPDEGFELEDDELILKGSSGFSISQGAVVTDNENGTFTIAIDEYWKENYGNTDLTISATFKSTAVTKYTLSADASLQNGSITIPTSEVAAGENASFTVVPATGYAIKANSVKAYKADDPQTAVSLANAGNGTYVITSMPEYDVTVTAEFEQATYSVALDTELADAATFTVTSPTGDIHYQDSVAFTLAPKGGYTLSNVAASCQTSGVDDPTIAENSDGSYAISSMPASNVWITATATPTEVAVPTAAANLTYDGTEKTGVAAGTGYKLSGTTAATDAGDYTATATLGEGYAWADDTTADKTISWSIARAATVVAPTAVKKLTYTGKKLTGVTAGTGYKLSGTTNATKAGTYTATATLADANHAWKDGTTAAKTVKWTIAQASNTAKAAKTSVSATKTVKSLKKSAAKISLPKVATKFGTATWSVKAKDKKGVLSLKSGKIQVKKGAKKGTYTIEIKASVKATSNYKAATTRVVTVKVRVK